MNSFLEKYKWELIYWITQFLYWGFLSLKGYFQTYYIEGYTFGSWHKAGSLVDFLTTLLLVIVVVFFLKNHLSWERFKFNDIIKVIAIIFFSGFIWTPLHVQTGYWLQILFFSENSYPQELKWESDRVIQVITLSLQMSSCVISYICIIVFKNFNVQRLKTSQLMSSLRQAQLSNLKNQINPHFLFNNLNNIRGLMLENPQKSKDMLTKLSEVLKHALRKNQFDVISIKEELKMVENYISLSKMQFETRLRYFEKINGDTLSFKIPPMIIQLLVENAIKHGVSNVKKGGRINLNIETNKDKLLIRVENNGKLSVIENSTGVGLKNIIKRLNFLYGDQATFTLKERGGMVVAEIKLPVEELIHQNKF